MSIPFYSIQQDSHPFLVLSDNNGPKSWDYGQLFQLRLTSHYMRLTARGLQFSTMSKAAKFAMPWTAVVSCTPTQHALCREGPGLVYFPDNVVDMPYDLSVIPKNSVLSYFPHGTCQGYSGRHITVDDVQYEVSLCDLVDANMDILLDTTLDELRWRIDKTNVTEYVFVSVVCVYLMSCISANVVRFTENDVFKITHIELGVLIVTIAYVTINLLFDEFGVWFGGLRYLLTTEDSLLAWLMWVYVICETAMVARPILRDFTAAHQLSLVSSVQEARTIDGVSVNTVSIEDGVQKSRTISGVSVYTGLIMLLTLRVHYTFDNPYIHVLVVMFGTRTFQKLSAVHSVDVHSKRWIPFVILDMVCFCAQLALAVGPAAGETFDAVLSQVTIATISMLLATVIEIQDIRRE